MAQLCCLGLPLLSLQSMNVGLVGTVYLLSPAPCPSSVAEYIHLFIWRLQSTVG
jgi:hypothetical protein